MLVLSRKVGETVVVSVPGFGPVVLVVTEIDRGKVKIGFDAPQDVLIHRLEVCPPALLPGEER